MSETEAADVVDLDGRWDYERAIRYVGLASRQPSGLYHCLAIIHKHLVWVELRITKTEKEDLTVEKT